MEIRGYLFNIVCLLLYVENILGVCPNHDTYPYSLFLDKEQRLEFSWQVNYQIEIVHFRLCLDLHNATMLGVGFSDYGEMEHSDFAVFWTGKSGVHHFQDMFTSEAGIPHIDVQQDYVLEKAHTDGQHIALQYWRKFDTCDAHDYKLDNGTTHVVYFISSQPMDAENIRHMSNISLSSGLQRIQLLKPEVRQAPLPEDTWSFEVTAPNIKVPARETTYWWYTTKLPPIDNKHHIIQYEGVIQSGHENLVHHMEVFHCEVAAHEDVRLFSGSSLAEDKPPELAACRKVIGAWAMGATAMIFPEEAGFPVGGPNYSPYVLLEVHYNNPGKIAGEIDASGIRFYVTSSLRRFDAGIMELGLEYTDKMVIPPRQYTFPLTGYCIEECTKVGLPAEGILIYASQLHTHLTGRRVYTKHVRDGVELPELNRDNHYSPHFQEIRRLPVPVRIMPGDALITTCEDKTLDRENVTFGGFSITDEMCVNYVHYYPVSDLEVCKSSVSTTVLQHFFAFMDRWDLDDTLSNNGYHANYQAIRWTPLTTLLLKTLYTTSPISMQCNQSDGKRFPGVWEDVPLTKIDQPLPSTTETC